MRFRAVLENPKLWVYRIVTLPLLLFLVSLNLRLYARPDSQPQTLLPHLRFLKSRLLAGDAQRMQGLFPEGYFFSYCLYGLSWIDLAIADPELTLEAQVEARWALAALETEVARAPFPRDCLPNYGVFYRGWSNWLRGGLLRLDPEGDERDSYQQECEVLARALVNDGPFLEAYPGQAWPCDTTVAVASLALHDHLYGPRYQDTIRDWLKQTGPELFPHQVRPGLAAPRGTSQVMILRFLFEIDPKRGRDQYEKFREKFVTTRFGLPGVREYPLGVEGAGDVDSGPLVFGFSFSATGVVPGAARLYGDKELSLPFGQLIGTFGYPIAGRYLGGTLPVADALLVWSRAAQPWGQAKPAQGSFAPVVGTFWRWGFHLFWLGIACLLLWPEHRLRVKA